MSSRNGKKSKKPLQTTLGKATLPNNRNVEKLEDLSVIGKPIHTSLFGLQAILKMFQTGTSEIQDYARYECDILYECRVCRNIFRSFANFILHKRNYCRDNFNPKDHFSLHKEVCNYDIVYTDILETAKDTSETDISKSSSDTSKNNLSSILKKIADIQKSEEIVNTALNDEETSKESSLAEDAGDKNNIAIEKIPTSSVGVFQTLFSNASSEDDTPDFMKTEVMELHGLLSNDEAVITSTGEVNSFQSDRVNKKPGIPTNNLICTVCNQKFSTRKTLTFHIKYKHNGKQMVYPCPECKDTFANPWCVFRHLCKVHRKSSAQIKRLRDQVHASAFRAGEQPVNIKGKDCNITSNSNTQIQENQQWMEDLEGANDLQMCGGCGKRFERKAALHSHSQMCKERIAVCNTLKENLKKTEEKEIKVTKSIDEILKGSKKRKPKLLKRTKVLEKNNLENYNEDTLIEEISIEENFKVSLEKNSAIVEEKLDREHNNENNVTIKTENEILETENKDLLLVEFNKDYCQDELDEENKNLKYSSESISHVSINEIIGINICKKAENEETMLLTEQSPYENENVKNNLKPNNFKREKGLDNFVTNSLNFEENKCGQLSCQEEYNKKDQKEENDEKQPECKDIIKDNVNSCEDIKEKQKTMYKRNTEIFELDKINNEKTEIKNKYNIFISDEITDLNKECKNVEKILSNNEPEIVSSVSKDNYLNNKNDFTSYAQERSEDLPTEKLCNERNTDNNNPDETVHIKEEISADDSYSNSNILNIDCLESSPSLIVKDINDIELFKSNLSDVNINECNENTILFENVDSKDNLDEFLISATNDDSTVPKLFCDEIINETEHVNTASRSYTFSSEENVSKEQDILLSDTNLVEKTHVNSLETGNYLGLEFSTENLPKKGISYKRKSLSQNDEIENKSDEVNKKKTNVQTQEMTLEMKASKYMDVKSLSCIPCKVTFKGYEKLLKHMSLHFRWYRFQCSKCLFMSYDKRICANHAFKQHDAHYVDNIVLPIPNWKTINISSDFQPFSHSNIIELEEDEGLSNVNFNKSYNFPSTSTSSLKEPLSPTKQEKVKKMIMEVIFGSKESVVPVKDVSNESRRPVRTRVKSVKTVSNDFVYDMAQILRPFKQIKETQSTSTQRIQNQHKRKKPLILKEKKIKMKSKCVRNTSESPVKVYLKKRKTSTEIDEIDTTNLEEVNQLVVNTGDVNSSTETNLESNTM